MRAYKMRSLFRKKNYLINLVATAGSFEGFAAADKLFLRQFVFLSKIHQKFGSFLAGLVVVFSVAEIGVLLLDVVHVLRARFFTLRPLIGRVLHFLVDFETHRFPDSTFLSV